MSARSELRQARKSLARGRTDEALVYLWNALEPARLERAGSLRELRRLATLIRDRGDEAERRDAERLLEAIGRGSADGDQLEIGTLSRPPSGMVGGVEPFEAESVDAEPADQQDDAGEPEAGRPRLGRLLLPILVLLIVLVNVIARLLDGR